MTKTIFDAPEPTTLAIQGEDARFPVRRIFCVGRNYAAHAREIGKDPDRDPPFFFTKPADAAFDAGVESQASIPYPSQTNDLHHEVELVVAIGTGGRDIEPNAVSDHIYGWAVGIDLTRRDLQKAAKESAQPWDFSKGFDLSAPIGPLGPKALATEFSPDRGEIRLSVDDDMRQTGDLCEMIWDVNVIVSTISRFMELKPGDLVMTGTPSGVGAVERGQTMRGQITGLPDVVVGVAP